MAMINKKVYRDRVQMNMIDKWREASIEAMSETKAALDFLVRLKELERRIAALEARIPVAPIDENEYRRALLALAEGNQDPLNNYMRRGGTIPVKESGK